MANWSVWRRRLAEFDAEDFLAGRPPRSKTNRLPVADLCNRILIAKVRKVEASELTSRR